MGIRGLETFLEQNCQNACYEVNIAELVARYRVETQCETVTIVVDGSSCLRHFYGDLNWIFGGQLKEYILKVTNFVNAFKALGINLVVFFDGASVNRKRPVWLNRRSDDVKKVCEVLDTVSKGTKLSYKNDKRLFLLPGGIGTLARCIFKYLCHCEVHTSVRECDEEIAEFARTNQCFAILGQDTDYVIYEGGKYYFSMKNLNISTMRTLCYNRLAFASFLQITPLHLPLVASLCGNDVVLREDLRSFHQRECRLPRSFRGNRQAGVLPFSVVLKGVANYIRRKRLGNDLSSRLPMIARDVFQDERKASYLETSLKSYSPQPEVSDLAVPQSNWDKILAHSKKHLMNGEIMPYALLSGSAFELCATLEDFRVSDLPAAADLLRPQRKATYGVLMMERPGGPGTVEEWCVSGVDTDRWHGFVQPLVPSQELHPGLLALWDEERTDLADKRWELFAYSVEPKLSAERLRQLPPILVIPAAILFYIRANIPLVAVEKSGYLEDWEVEALILQAVLVESTELSEIMEINIELPYNSRAIRLGSIFMRAVTQMLILLAACGFPIPMEQAMPWHYFDGKVFHQTYKRMLAGETSAQLAGDKMPLFEELCDLVFESNAK